MTGNGNAFTSNPILSCFGMPTRWGWLLVGLLSAAGCDFGEPPVEAPAFDAGEFVQKVMAQCDADQSGSVSKSEAKAAPSIADVFDEIDTDSDKSLSPEELQKRMAAIIESRVGMMSIGCVVLRNDKPVPGVTVRFIPEPFVADLIGPAEGVTSERGIAVLVNETTGLAGISPGYYRVELSLQSGGRELVPAKFNTNSTLGKEVSFDSEELRMSGQVVFRI